MENKEIPSVADGISFVVQLGHLVALA